MYRCVSGIHTQGLCARAKQGHHQLPRYSTPGSSPALLAPNINKTSGNKYVKISQNSHRYILRISEQETPRTHLHRKLHVHHQQGRHRRVAELRLGEVHQRPHPVNLLARPVPVHTTHFVERVARLGLALGLEVVRPLPNEELFGGDVRPAVRGHACAVRGGTVRLGHRRSSLHV